MTEVAEMIRKEAMGDFSYSCKELTEKKPKTDDFEYTYHRNRITCAALKWLMAEQVEKQNSPIK